MTHISCIFSLLDVPVKADGGVLPLNTDERKYIIKIDMHLLSLATGVVNHSTAPWEIKITNYSPFMVYLLQLVDCEDVNTLIQHT